MAPESTRRVVIVGASLAGLRTAEELRSAGFEGAITLVGNENHLPYDRPPLSKQVLAGTRSAADVTLRGRSAIEGLDVELRLGCTATAVEDRGIRVDGGERIPFSDLVIATGVSARRLSGQPDERCVHLLRTVDDSVRLRDHLQRANGLVIIGAGFIGAEVAAVARSRGLEVTMLEALPTPLAGALGNAVGARCARLHAEHGVRILTNARVSEFDAKGTDARITLADGSVLETDCVLVGVGTRPNTNWLSGLGVAVTGGVPCDETGLVEGTTNVYAAGDVAAWYSPSFGHRHRVEHWTNASEQARVVARSIVGLPVGRKTHELPYFWSDQYDIKIQLIGRPDLADHVQVAAIPDKPGRLLATYYRSARLVAALTFGAPGVLARYRPLVTTMADEEEVRAGTPDLAPSRA
jgi:NADPH-dependent 2,4-dienoyl-CoA reductase/sulfur reductase-like enzyme